MQILQYTLHVSEDLSHWKSARRSSGWPHVRVGRPRGRVTQVGSCQAGSPDLLNKKCVGPGRQYQFDCYTLTILRWKPRFSRQRWRWQWLWFFFLLQYFLNQCSGSLMCKILIWALLLFGYEANCEGSSPPAWCHHWWVLHVTWSANTLQDACTNRSSIALTLKIFLMLRKAAKYCGRQTTSYFIARIWISHQTNIQIKRRINNFYNRTGHSGF